MAAFAVVICHIVDKIPEISARKNHFTNLFANWGTESVMIFFILSGIVIHSSFEKKPRTSFVFLVQRIIRLHPTLFLSISISVLAGYLAFSTIPSITTILGNLIPVSNLGRGLVPVLSESNPVIWSLSYEVFFYTVFGLFIISGNKVAEKRVLLWFVFSVAAIGLFYTNPSSIILNYLFSMLANSTIWLIGFFIWQIKEKIGVSLPIAGFSLGMLPLLSRLHLTSDYYDPIKYALFAVASIPLFIFLISGSSKERKPISKYSTLIALCVLFISAAYVLYNDAGYNKTVKIAYLSLPLLLYLCFLSPLTHVVRIIYKRCIEPIFSYIGKISYSVYLFHFPILILVYYLLNVPLALKISLILFITFWLSYFIEVRLQPVITSRFLKRL